MTLFCACAPQIESVFDDTSANRIDADLENIYEILVSPANGWLMEYYPSAERVFGGFNVLMSFTPDYKVTVASESFASDKTAVSTYTLKQSAGSVLAFDTYNEIFHYYAEPETGFGYGVGYGFEGDFEFLVVSATEDKIVLKGKKTGSYAYMTPFSPSMKWKEYLDEIREETTFLENYYRLQYRGDGDIYEARMSNHLLYVLSGSGERNTYYPFIVTLMGCKFYTPVSLGGDRVEGIVFNPGIGEDGAFIPTNDDASGMFIPTYPSLNEMVTSKNWFFGIDNFSPWGQELWAQVRDELDAMGEKMTYCHLGNVSNIYGDYFAFNFLCTSGTGFLSINYEYIGEDQIALQFGEEGNITAKEYYTEHKFNLLLTPLGNEKKRTFTLTTDDKKDPKWIKFVDNSDPDNYFTLYRNVIYYPLNSSN